VSDGMFNGSRKLTTKQAENKHSAKARSRGFAGFEVIAVVMKRTILCSAMPVSVIKYQCFYF
jgi:hypothetical protein